MAETYDRVAGQLANTSTALYTAQGGSVETISFVLILFNTGATVETVKIHLYDGSTSRQQIQADIQPLGPAEIFLKAALKGTDEFRAHTTTASTVNYWLSYTEIA